MIGVEAASGSIRGRRNPCPYPGQIVRVVRIAAADGVEKELPQAHGYWAGDAVADRASVNAGDRGDLDAGAAEERLVDDVELGAVDVALLDRDALVASELHHRAAGDPLQDVAGYGGRDERT